MRLTPLAQACSVLAAGLGALALAGCGGGGGSGKDSTSSLSRLRAEPSGVHCASGGVLIEAGRDSDGDGSLADAEVARTQYVCSGEQGGVLMSVSPDLVDDPCTDGGFTLKSGADVDADGQLDDDEVAATQAVCLDVASAPVLIDVSAEVAGDDCDQRSSRIQAGLDTDGSGTLGADEIESTTHVCHPEPTAGVRWTQVNGTQVQAAPNIGYMAAGSAAVTITLPPSEDLAIGDLVAVTGLGSSSWTIAQNEGQTVYGGSLGHTGVAWTPRDADRGWQGIASSDDGRKLAAVEYGGRVYTSTDAGSTWTARETARLWYAIDSSADGSRLIAGVPSGQLHTSADGGVTWTARESARSWYSVASSADGLRLLASAGGEQLYVSDDGGETWTARDSNRLWFAVASSADGERLVAAEYGGQVYTSIDRGVTWIPRETNRAWASLTSSSDGMKLAAAVFGGRIYTSANGGVTWFERASIGNWIDVTSSDDGRRLVAIESGGLIHTSDDGGATWRPQSTNHNWSSVTSSADGEHLAAVEHGGKIHVSTPYSTTGTAGSVQGGAFDAIELQYRGDGMFAPLSHEGDLVLN